MNREKIRLNFRSIDQALYNILTEKYPFLANKKHDYHLFYWYILDNLIREKELFIPFQTIQNWSEKTTSKAFFEQVKQDFGNDIRVTNYSVEHHICRRISLKTNDFTTKVKYLYSRQSKDSRVFIATGKVFKPLKRIKKKIKDHYTECHTFNRTKSHLEGILDYSELTTRLVNNKSRTKMLIENIELALETLESDYELGNLSGSQYDQFQDILNSYRDYHHYVIYEPTKELSPRVFGNLDQGLPTKYRSILYRDCLDFDIEASSLNIVAGLAGDAGDELREMLRHSFWEQVMAETFGFTEDAGCELSQAQFKLLKKHTKVINNVLINTGKIPQFKASEFKYGVDNIPKHVLKDYSGSPLNKALSKAVNALRSEVKAKGCIQIGETKRAIPGDLKITQALAHKIQYIESMIIYALTQEIDRDRNLNLIVSMHDGLMVTVSNPTLNPLKRFNEIAKRVGNEYGVPSIKIVQKHH